MNRLHDLERFYDLLYEYATRSGGFKRLEECSGGMEWPRRGVYFFFEAGEQREDSGAGPRVVRVGTHAITAGSQTTLWNRLSQHRGSKSSGAGNHRGSVFRLLVGSALIHRSAAEVPSWGVGSSAPASVRIQEKEFEEAVSRYIGQMQVITISVSDDPGPSSLRGYIERNAIGLLSNFGRQPLDQSSGEWLGRFCPKLLVRESGLWNQNHVRESHISDFLDTLKNLLRRAQSE